MREYWRKRGYRPFRARFILFPCLLAGKFSRTAAGQADRAISSEVARFPASRSFWAGVVCCINALEGATGATISATKTAATESNAYKLALEAKRVLSRKGVPTDGRWLIASPEYLEVLMLDDHFIKQGDLAQELVQSGVVGRIAGFNVFESNNMDFESTTRVASKKTTTEFIAGHPNWCHRVMEWQVGVHLQDLNGSGKFIGASAVQGRKVYGIKVSKPQTLYIKRVEAAVG